MTERKLEMKLVNSTMAFVIRWCVSGMLAVIVAIPAFASLAASV
jgi:hypothetical protein